MKSWKLYEEVTKMIFSTLESNPLVKIRTNVPVPDIHGDDRQIDVLIEHEIGSIPVSIAIECKEHNHTISIDKIEAFNSKCDRLPSIHRKVFVAKDGYQSGAISAAKDFKIELYQLSEIEKNKSILCDLDNYRLSIDKRLCVVSTIKIYTDRTDDLILKNDQGYSITFLENKQKEYLWNFPNSFLYSIAQSEWLKYAEKLDGKLRNVPIRIIPNSTTHLFEKSGNLLGIINCIDLYLKLSGEIVELKSSNSRAFQKHNEGTAIAETKEFKGISSIGEDMFLNLVNANNNHVKVFCTITDQDKIIYNNSENLFFNTELITGNITK